MRFLVFIILIFIHVHVQSQTIYGRTLGKLPFLEYGVGDDRLGGAKMGYLDSNILIKVVDSTEQDYKVQLSNNHYAYLNKRSFLPDSAIKIQPHYLTSSWRVFGDDKYDYVTISLPERLPYRTIQQINPSRIIIDIFGATSNTNWITQLKTVKEIRNAWYEQIEDDVYRVFIELNHKQHWGYYVYYNKNTLTLRVKRQPSSLKLRNLHIAIDAGHGGSSTGATGITTKALEKDYTLKIAKELEHLLCRKGAGVLMTRCDDTDVAMIDRTLMLREYDPDLMISIHLNSSSNKNVKGVSTYYRYQAFRPLSQKILDRMLELKLNNFGNIGAFNFSLSGPTEYPNCLVEVAFLSNEEDEKRILDPRFHKEVAY
ncbi:MAG TPA: N-acetylmuramoyl-L-alanine amidase, partial [Chitinophagaceae bacterium]